MYELGQIVEKVRSKNAGPFWITIDIFCGNRDAFERVKSNFETSTIAKALNVPSQTLKRFDIETLNVVKFSLPRPQIQGSVDDRDMHGAAIAARVAELDCP